MNNRPVVYLQIDPKWSKKAYSNKNESATIGGSGCGPTSMAMVLATWVDPFITPVTTCNWAQKHGYKATGNGTYQTYFVAQAKAYGLECTKLNETSFRYMSQSAIDKVAKKAKDYVDDGYIVICLMGKGLWTKTGHFIVWYSNDGDNVFLNDPASTKPERNKNTFKKLVSEARYFWAIKPPKEVISMTNSEVKQLIKEAVADALKKGVTPAAPVITNVPSDWAKDFWYSASKAGLMDGTNAKGNVTREQLATVLVSAGVCPKLNAPNNFDFKNAKY